MSKLDDNGIRELTDRLKLSPRRVNQLIELGVLVEGGNGLYDVELNVRRYRAYRDSDFDYIEREFTDAYDALIAGLDRMKAEPDVRERRVIAKRDNIGPQIGRVDNALLLLGALTPEGHRGILKMAVNPAIGALIFEFFDLQGIKVSDEPKEPTRKARKRARAA